MPPQEEPRYNNGNKAFLQALLARGAITFQESRPIIAAILNVDRGQNPVQPERIQEQQFKSFLQKASEAVSKFDFEIRSTIHQTTNERVYALVNTTSDPQTQLATTYNPDELSFIKRLLDAMFDTYNSPRAEVIAITEMQAIKVARPPRGQSLIDENENAQTPIERGLKHSEVETVLASLVEGGWLEKSYSSFYSLSPRALLELRPWLTETYNDPDTGPDEWRRIKFCHACKDIVTVGLRCNKQGCNFRLHAICEEAFWRTQKDKKCLKCSTEWTGEKWVGEKAAKRSSRQRGGRDRGGLSRQTTADGTFSEGGVEEDAEDSEENIYDS